MKRREFLRNCLIGTAGAVISAAAISVPLSPLINIPTHRDYIDNVWKGFISRVLVFDRALSPEEIAEVHKYLHEQYGIESTPCPVGGALVSMQATNEGALTIYQDRFGS